VKFQISVTASTLACAQGVCGDSLRVEATPGSGLVSELEQASVRSAIANNAIVNGDLEMGIPIESLKDYNVSFDDPEIMWTALQPIDRITRC
jgi:hypothetical protein